jgi:uncharacterized protein
MHLAIASFIIGILIGLTSIGGAALMTPFLIVFAGVRPLMAVGTDLVYGALTRIVGAGMHWRQGSVDLRVVRLLALGSVPASLLGFLAGHNLYRFGINGDEWVRHAIGVVLVVVAVGMLYRTIFFGKTSHHPPQPPRPALTVAVGALVGFTVGLTSIGSGSLLVPFLVLLFPKSPSRVVGTDVFHAAILVTASAFLYINVGQVEWQLVPALLAGSIPGVIIGSMLAARLPVRPLRVGLSVLLFATGYQLI